MCFISLLIFDTKYPVDTGVSIALTLVGLFNIVAMCMVPSGVMPNLLMRKAEGKFGQRNRSDTEKEDGESSDNNADEQDHMLPMTYGSRDGRLNSNKPERSDIWVNKTSVNRLNMLSWQERQDKKILFHFLKFFRNFLTLQFLCLVEIVLVQMSHHSMVDTLDE